MSRETGEERRESKVTAKEIERCAVGPNFISNDHPHFPPPAPLVRGSRRLVMRKESYITIPLDALIHACVRRLDNETDKLRFIDFARR